jgi:hypothetical protein
MPAPWNRDIIVGKLKELVETAFTSVYLWGFPTTPAELVDVVRITDATQQNSGLYKNAEKTIPIVITITSAPQLSEELARASAVNNMGLLLDALGADRTLKNINGGTPLLDGMFPTSDRIDVDNVETQQPLATVTINIDLNYTANAFDT